MALLSDLVKIVAAVEGLEEVSVGIFARHAREAGLITQGGRGRSAAKMTTRDAANLLLAVNGCALAKDISDIVPRLRALPIYIGVEETAVGLGLEGAQFGDDFEHLLELVAGPKFVSVPGQVFVRFFRPIIRVEITAVPRIRGEFRSEQFVYRDWGSEVNWPSPDRSDETVISQITMRRLMEALNN